MVLLIRVGDFYEAYGLDALMLVEHANLNPMGRLSLFPTLLSHNNGNTHSLILGDERKTEKSSTEGDKLYDID